MRISSLLSLLALFGCSGDAGGKGDDPTGSDDTADTDVVYEPGCITVDGGGGYAHLADAVAVASEGSVVELCEGSWEEAIVVDKSVTLRGSLGVGSFLYGPGSDVPLTITAAGVTVENLTIESPRTAIVLDGATDASLTDITVQSAGSWGVSATDATATFDGLTLVQPAAGGIEVSGGEIAIANGDLQYPGSFGIVATDDAVVNLSSTTITGTLMLTDDVSDGYAVQLDGASLTMTDSAIVGADGIGIYGVDADVTLANTTIADAVYLGVFAFDSTYDFDGVAITGSYLQGAYLDGPEIALADTSVSVQAGTSCSLSYEDWGQDGNPWCGGINLVGDVVELENVSVSGYENYGVIVQPNEESAAALTWNGGTVEDVGRWGVYTVYATGSVTDVAVVATREPELSAPCDGYVDQSAAFLTVYSELALDGVTLADNAGWGLSSLLGDITVQGATFDGNACIGFVNYQGQAVVTGSTFTNGSDRGGAYDAQGVLTLDGNTFQSNKSGAVYEYDYGTYIGRSVYTTGQGQDLFAYASGAIYVTNNTFTDGDASITVQSAGTVEVTGNTWTGYESYIAYFYQLETSAAYLFADNSVDDSAGPVVQALYGPVEVSNVTVGTTRLSEPVSYEWYQDDVLQYSYSYQSSYPVFSANGYYYDDGAGTIVDSPASLTLEDVTVESAYASLVYAYDAEVDLDSVEAAEVGNYAVDGIWYNFAPDVEGRDIAIGSTGATAFSLMNYFTEYGSLTLEGVSVDSSGGGIVSASAVGSVEVQDATFGDVAGTAFAVTTRSYDYSYVYDETTGTYSYSYTDLDANTFLALTGVTVAAAAAGVDQQGGSARFTSVELSGTTGNAVSAQGLTALDADGLSIVAPGATGLVVDDTYVAYSYELGTYQPVDGDTVVTLLNSQVTGAGGDAFDVSGGSVTMSGTSGTASGGSGLVLASTTADVQGNVFTGNTDYGMVCGAISLSACAANDVSGNGLGAHLGCSDACGE